MMMSREQIVPLLEKIAAGQEYSILLSPASNQLHINDARCIVRRIPTPNGGLQLAYHELTYGRTGSGIYGGIDEMLTVIERYQDRFLKSPMYERFYKDREFRWTCASEIDLPINLIL